MDASNSWQRHYVKRTSVALMAFIAGILVLMGLVFALVGATGLSERWLFLVVGVALLIIAPAVAVISFYFGENVDIACGPDGFSVTRESRRKGKSHESYKWTDVTDTEYEESRHRSSRDRESTTTQYFSVHTDRGNAFRVSHAVSDFPDLINVFNSMTPQLPYVWTPQAGFSVSIGPISAGRRAYAKTARPSTPASSGVAAAAGSSTAPVPFPAKQNARNKFGLIGLLISIISLPTCGILSPIGLLVSGIGLFRPNKSLAILGTVVGIIGTGMLVFMVSQVAQSISSASNGIAVESLIVQARQQIDAHRMDEGELPSDAAGQLLMASYISPYGNSLLYRRLLQDQFEIRCSGPDGKPDTDDDTALRFGGEANPAVLETASPAPPESPAPPAPPNSSS